MNDLTLGDKIKYYRQRAKKSQLELELETGLSTGTISRIENNSINPTKETLTRISEKLKLKPSELAYLLGLHIFSIFELTEAIEKISKSITVEATLQTAVDLMYDLYPNYNGGFILLPDKSNENLIVTTISKIPNIEMFENFLHRKVNEFPISLKVKNFITQCYETGNVLQTYDVINFTKYILPDIVVTKLSGLLGFQSGIVLRLEANKNVIGAIVYTKRVKQEFNEEEIKMLQLLNEKIAEILDNKLKIKYVE